MTQPDITRVHERIDGMERNVSTRFDELNRSLRELASAVSAVAAQCGICGKTVLGNGKPPLAERVSHMESGIAATREEIQQLKESHQEDHDAIVRLDTQDAVRVRIGWKAAGIIVGLATLAWGVLQAIAPLVAKLM